MSAPARCWCGNENLTPFSDAYARCPTCETLVSIARQSEKPGLPDITTRSRTDFIERIPYWLRSLLKYKLPPAKTLELGCAHGGMVALMRQAGFDATGLDLSQANVEFARETFNVPVLTGPLEEQALEAASLDAIILMDVLEHLCEPQTTLKTCRELLKPDGVLVVQTPCYPEGRSHADLIDQNHPFMGVLQAGGPVALFSRSSLRQALSRSGFNFIASEPAFLSDRDVFFVAGAAPIQTFPLAQAEEALQASPASRLALALLDQDAQKRVFQEQLRSRWAELDHVDARELGLFFYDHNDFAGADQAFRQAIRRRARDANACVDLAVLRYEQKDFQDAIKWCMEAARLDPLKAEAWAGMALAAYEVNNGDILRTAYQRLEQIAPGHPVLLELAAESQPIQGDPARPAGQQTIQADELTQQALQAYSSQDRKGAERLFLQALKCSPNHFNALVSLGKLYYERSRYTEARSYLRSATTQRPEDADAWVGLALAASRLNDRPTVREAYHKAQALDPSHPQLKNLARWN